MSIQLNFLKSVKLISSFILLVVFSACGGGGGGSGSGSDDAPINSLPVSNAGVDQTVIVGDIVALDGSESYDPDGTPITYAWSFQSIPVDSSAVLDDVSSVNPSFTADLVGEYSLELVVNDGEVNSSVSTVVVTAVEPNSPPVADAGLEQTLVLGSTVTLDGSGSSDVNGQQLSYSWTFVSKPENSTSVIIDSLMVAPSFDPDFPGEYIIALVVNDGEEDSLPDEVTVTVGTGIEGILSVDTTLVLESSPYIVTDDIQLAYLATLIVDPGVKIIGNDLDIEIFGDLDINGNAEQRVILDDVNIVPGNGPIGEWFNMNIDYVITESGSIYAPTGNNIRGSINLNNSVLQNMDYMYIWYPKADSTIEKNIFINSGGISLGHSDGIKVSIKNNVFYQPTGGGGSIYAIRNWASYDTSSTVLEFNSFLSVDMGAVELRAGYSDAKLTAENNFWNTTDGAVIEGMIFDENDDVSAAGEISYEPFLTEPHIDTPDPTPYLPINK